MATKLDDFFVTLGIRGDGSLKRGLQGVSEFFKALPGFQMAVNAVRNSFDAVTGDFAALGDRIAKTSRAYGIAGEELQRLEFAAQRSGVGVDALRMALSALPKRVGAASRGSKEAAQVFRDLGLSVSELAALSPDEQFKRVGAAIGGVQDETARTNLALRLFEESGARLIPLFKEGEAGINALGDELAALGGIIDKDTLAAAEEYQDLMLNLSMVVRGLTVKAFKAISPLVTGFTKALIALRPHATRIVRALGSVALALGIVASAMGVAAVAAQVKMLAAVVAATGGWVAYGSAVLASAAATLVAVAPYLAFIAVLIGVALILEDVIAFVTGANSAIGQSIDKLKEAGGAAGAFGEILDFVFGGFGEWLADTLEWLSDLDTAIEDTKNMLASVGNALGFGDGARVDVGFASAATANQTATVASGAPARTLQQNNPTTINVTSTDPQEAARLIEETMRRRDAQTAAMLEASLAS